jgi:hypothetical protein
MKNSSDTIGNRTRDLPACSAMPQQTAPPRARQCNINIIILLMSINELTVKWIGDLNPTSEISIHYFVVVQWAEKLSSYERLLCALYAIRLASLRILTKARTDCVMNTTDFTIVNLYFIKRRYSILLSAPRLYPAPRVVFGGLQLSDGAQTMT